jgi:orotidine-5'-phosphate decarboxylase
MKPMKNNGGVQAFLAADGLSIKEKQKPTLTILDELDATGLPYGIKINLDLVTLLGLKGAVELVQGYDRPIFVDLKMKNGKGTMSRVAQQLVNLEVDFFNVYAIADSQLSGVVEVVEDTNTKVIGVSELTHYANTHYQKHYQRDIGPETILLVKTVIDAKLHGALFPGTQLETVMRNVPGAASIMRVNPGIRKKGYTGKKHQQDITAAEAEDKGATHVVLGSIVMKDKNPAKALELSLADLRGEPQPTEGT